MSGKNTIATEDRYMVPFFTKQPISIDRGEGVYVWDEEGTRYLDFTSGWGVTCLGHAHPEIRKALTEQGGKIIQNPNSGLTYSPARADLLSVLFKVLPEGLTHVFFSNSGAEANDAAIKLARKITGRLDVVSTVQSFHGRTISTASATGQASHRDKFKPQMPNYRFIPFDDLDAAKGALDGSTAAMIVEPIQAEGGVRVPATGYMAQLSELCRKNGSMLIVDEIQTGFCRTGAFFGISDSGAKADFLTMAKGIAGGFPFGGFAVTQEVADAIEKGDHGGTYCGNPLGCAVSHAVIRTLIDENICENVNRIGRLTMERLRGWQRKYPESIIDVRGKGLLILIEFADEETATKVSEGCLAKKLFVRQTQGTGLRLFPALNITQAEMEEGLAILEKAIEGSVG
jgi:acetylornithine/N-succinyldiaminopimelate aminotransferase